MSQVEQTRQYVTQAWMRLKGRPLDDPTVEFYSRQIMEGKLSTEAFEGLLVESPTFQDLVPKGVGQSEVVPVSVPVEVNVRVTSEMISKIIMQSALWNTRYKPLLDAGTYIHEHVSEEFWRVFYETSEQGDLKFEEFLKMLKSYADLKEMKLH